jgi:hypothetical protein
MTRTDAMACLLAFYCALALGCSRVDASDSLASAGPAPKTAPVASPPPASSVSAEGKVRASFAVFVDSTLATCIDMEVTQEKLDQFSKNTAGTKLKQTCSSLGRAALTACDRGDSVWHYYDLDHSDKYMAECVKSGGQWTTNKSAEAELERAQQSLKKMQ